MKKNIKNIIVLLFLIAVLVLPYFVFAQTPLDGLKNVAESGGYSSETSDTTMSAIIGTVISAVLSVLGVIFLALFIYAGYTWMTAGGDESKLEKAKKTMNRAVIGLIITVGSWAIYQFVFQKLFFDL